MNMTKLQKRNAVREMIREAKKSGNVEVLVKALDLLKGQDGNKKAQELLEKVNALLPKQEVLPKFVIVRTKAGDKTHLAEIKEGSNHRFVSCGVIKNAGTALIDIKGEVSVETITCEKCRIKHGLK